MQWGDEAIVVTKRRIDREGSPYRFDLEDGTAVKMIAIVINEQDFYEKESDSWVPKVRVVAEMEPEQFGFEVGQEIRVYHVDNPGNFVDLTYGIGHDGDRSLGAFYGEGSMLLMGDLRHALEVENDY